ncbi:hypothetical protein ACFC09_44015 [Streptomyces sp. NPDC056161]|uniref:hypothetical protein n=1 Tax=Streptomyces sp. NPDC056161 TaxID=3345732 RepID=UPI0035E11484
MSSATPGIFGHRTSRVVVRTTERLAGTEDPEHRQLLRHFVTWHQMRRLRAKAEKAPLGRSRTNHTKQEVTQAGAFLAWLAGQGRAIAQ